LKSEENDSSFDELIPEINVLRKDEEFLLETTDTISNLEAKKKIFG